MSRISAEDQLERHDTIVQLKKDSEERQDHWRSFMENTPHVWITDGTVFNHYAVFNHLGIKLGTIGKFDALAPNEKDYFVIGNNDFNNVVKKSQKRVAKFDLALKKLQQAAEKHRDEASNFDALIQLLTLKGNQTLIDQLQTALFELKNHDNGTYVPVVKTEGDYSITVDVYNISQERVGTYWTRLA